jgi:glycosyltransferase involved in cell wall biosynthesis
MPPSPANDSLEGLRCLAIIPAFNESGSVGRVVQAIHRELPRFDIVVIDDGSVDATVREVPGFARVISLPFNLGIGGAMQTGYRYAALHGYDLAVQVDADGQHPPEEMHKLLHSLLDGGDQGPCDMVIGSRFVSTVKYRQTFARMVGIHFLRHLIKLLVGLWITDPTSGYRAANQRVIRAFAHWYPDDYPEPEVVLLLHRGGFRVREVQVEMLQRTTGVTSIPTLRGVFYVVKVATCLLLDMFRLPWPEAKVGPRRDWPRRPPAPQAATQPAAQPSPPPAAAGVPQP